MGMGDQNLDFFLLVFALHSRGIPCLWSAIMDVKSVLIVLTALFTLSSLFFATKNGFYDTDNYHGNGSAH